MNFFTATKIAAFATKISAAAGFDFEAARAAGNENALKDFIAAAVAAGNKPNADAEEQIKTLNAALEEANATNTNLTAALSGIGIKIADDATSDTIKASLESHIKVRASAILAQSGHPALPAIPEDNKKNAPAANLTGRDRYRADFIRQIDTRTTRN